MRSKNRTEQKLEMGQEVAICFLSLALRPLVSGHSTLWAHKDMCFNPASIGVRSGVKSLAWDELGDFGVCLCLSVRWDDCYLPGLCFEMTKACNPLRINLFPFLFLKMAVLREVRTQGN